MKKIFVVFVFSFLLIQLKAQFTVSGTVKFESEPLPGAHVKISGTELSLITNAEGKFSIKLKNGTYSIEISYLGHETIQSNFSVLDKDTELNYSMKQSTTQLAAMEIVYVRKYNTAPSQTDLSQTDLSKANVGQDLPILLEHTPSVVTSSDAGNGVGYTGIRIRGTDPTRINVTVNGIPVNDAESHGVFWVDFPDLVSSVNSIQIQRGVGTSTNGSGAFGGSINIHTLNESEKPHAIIANSFGSFNTHKHTLNFGTGHLKGTNRDNYFSIDGRLSMIKSDGYIDRAFSDMKSYYISSAYHKRNSNLRFVVFSGKEKTYQAWGGVPRDSLETNRKYNPYTYEDETDNYIQTNYQLLYNFKIRNKLKGNLSFHYTKGDGYYEQFKEGESFSDYGLTNIIIGSDTLTETDLIRRRWLDNDFYGTVFSLDYNVNEKLMFLFGGGWNQYDGKHFGEIIWAQYSSNSNIREKYYDNNAIKTDWNVYTKASYWIGKKINLIADLQIRNIDYEFLGYDNNLNNVTQTDQLFFFNPKFGLTFYLNSSNLFYSSVAVANKEPNRDDYTQSTPNSRPRPEKLTDIEFGYTRTSYRWLSKLNFYYMNYKDQLVLTGKINDVGAYIRQNIEDSYRAGVEMEVGFNLNDAFTISANATLSQNKISQYIEYIDNYDTWLQDSVIHTNADIAFSPNVIIGANLNYKLKLSQCGSRFFYVPVSKRRLTELNFSALPKFVGKQFMDNTSNDNRSLDAYFVTDFRVTMNISNKDTKRFLNFNFVLRNAFNELYANNAWTYSYIYGGEQYTDFGYYPQAGINYMIGLTFGF